MSEALEVIKDGSDQSFMADVIEASQETPVVSIFGLHGAVPVNSSCLSLSGL